MADLSRVEIFPTSTALENIPIFGIDVFDLGDAALNASNVTVSIISVPGYMGIFPSFPVMR